jgi:hypothetical protein
MFGRTGRAVIRTAILLIFSAGAVLYGAHMIEEIRDHYADLQPVPSGQEDQIHKQLGTSLAKQSETLIGWSVLALAGAVTLVISTKVRQVRGLSWAFISFGPGGAFLLESTYAGLVFQRRIAFMTAQNNFGDFAGLNALLNAQTEFFVWALGIFSLLAAFFLVLIVFGLINPSS